MLKNYFAWTLLGLLLLISASLMIYASLEDSAIMDELAHIPAGYSYVRYLDYRLNPEHPPLLKMLSGIPLLFANLNFPIESNVWKNEINGQWAAGAQFLYESSNDADRIIRLSRIAPILLTLILIVFIYVWGRELLGRWWALVPSFFFALSPTVLAHGHYVTTDIAATFGFFITLYYFIKFLFNSTNPISKNRNLILASLAFGIAQLLKFSNIILIPILLLIGFAYYFVYFKNEKLIFILKNTLSCGLKILLIFFIGFLFVYPFYYITTLNYPAGKQKTDTEFILSSFAEGPDKTLSSCKILSGVSLKRRVRCLAEATILMTESKILRPYAEYLLGLLMVIQRGSGGNTIYFLGEVSPIGYWYYFPLVFLLKEPSPSLMFIILAFIFGVYRILKSIKQKKGFMNYLNTNFHEFSMILFIAIYWFISIRSPLNIGVRHIMPTLPFIYILATGSIKKWTLKERRILNYYSFLDKIINFIKTTFRSSFKISLITLLLAWYFVNTLISAPYFLSYFNVLGGGENGYKYVTDSNFDWGQDLKRLKSFVEKNKIDKIAVDYFGGGNPKYYLQDKAEYWGSNRGNPKKQGIHWLALSINTLQGARGKSVKGFKRNLEDEYVWLDEPYKPYARAGTSIFIYRLD